MTRYQATFDRLREQQRGAFVPFVTLGDPSPELSLAIIDTLIENGADIHAKNNKGQTALDFAKTWNRKEIIRLLKARGATE